MFTIKNDCEIVEKKKIIENVFIITYKFVEGFQWEPGQFVGITINKSYRRSYSIFSYSKDLITFLIDTKPGGIASQFFEEVKLGEKNQILGPYGKFTLNDNPMRKVLICTGTGIAPFIPMIKKYSDKDFLVLFGVRKNEDDYGFKFIKECKNVTYIRCVSREEPSDSFEHISFKGRVTDWLNMNNLDNVNSEYYICGNPNMVSDVNNLLNKKGIENIYVEKYG